MKLIIKSRFTPKVSIQQTRQAIELAQKLLVEKPAIQCRSDSFRHLMLDSQVESAPSLHIDDFSEIPLLGKTDSSAVLQQRARLRAVDGDYVALSKPIDAGYAKYCEQYLQLGQVQWLVPITASAVSQNVRVNDTAIQAIDQRAVTSKIAIHLENERDELLQRKLAFLCWKDRHVRNELVHAVRRKGLRYIHPHISTLHIWELAAYLRRAARRPVKVIGPTPALARLANDKIEFSHLVVRLFGKQWVPHTESAYNLATLAKIVARLAPTHVRLGIKFPFGVGGTGNFLVDTTLVRGLSLAKIRDFLMQLLPLEKWPPSGRVLVDVWEQQVLTSPSVQTWIPPLNSAEPIIEGVFSQFISSQKGTFVGSKMATFPEELQQKIVDCSYLLAVLFQQLGYVGRCSFDLILVGEALDNCRIEFIECNARWGGTSSPMTLMNQFEQIVNEKKWAVHKIHVPGLDQMNFNWLLKTIENRLYDPRSNTGDLVFFNPARIPHNSAIEAIAIADSSEDAQRVLRETLPQQLATALPRSVKGGCQETDKSHEATSARSILQTAMKLKDK